MVTLNFSATYVLVGTCEVNSASAGSFLLRKTKPCYAIRGGGWEGKMGTYIITQMTFGRFLNAVSFCLWNGVSEMIKRF